MRIWDWLPLFQLSAIVVAHNVGILFPKHFVKQVSPNGFCATITHLLCVDNHLTIWLPLVGLYSGTLEFAFLLLQ